ncbi:protein adenylyltransferase SelO [Natronocella acetinitrilica]|nr:YdiU family protein [Natronocella acetinitrilica]
MTPSIDIGPLSSSYAQLPSRFYTGLGPTPVARPGLIAVNRDLAQELGLSLGAVSEQDLAEVFSGNRLPQGSEPIAMAYAGHQFGHFVPQLGDGRAILLGEVVDGQGRRRDIQLKGAGRTPYSRGGDGRAALGPVLREYLVSEAMHAMGVPTTRALAAVTTGEAVLREEPLPGAVVTRVAASHIRVGTFQFFAARGDVEAVRQLTDYAIARHDPDLTDADNPPLAFLGRVMDRQAALIAQWMAFGFIHGVMNTDNCTVSGETIDYGPCAFMDAYNPQQVFSAIDRQGRYAFDNQPAIAQWNLARLADCLLPLIDSEEQRAIELAVECLEAFPARYEAHRLSNMRGKLGLRNAEAEDAGLIQDLHDLMHRERADFTLTFRSLSNAVAPGAGLDSLTQILGESPAAEDWMARWRDRVAREAAPAEETVALMRQVNPAYIPRNHQLERVIESAIGQQDFEPFHRLLAVVTHPYDERPEWESYLAPPSEEERVRNTFCGT